MGRPAFFEGDVKHWLGGSGQDRHKNETIVRTKARIGLSAVVGSYYSILGSVANDKYRPSKPDCGVGEHDVDTPDYPHPNLLDYFRFLGKIWLDVDAISCSTRARSS